jgi:DNA-binding transcriptional ArsR family regulator
MRTARAKKDTDTLTAIFGALANPTRRAILDQLATGVYSVSELAAPFKMRQPSISKHLKVLENAGLVERGKDAQWRPRALDTAPLEEANAYLEKFRTHMEDRLDRLERYLEKLKATQAATNESTDL